MIDTSPVQSGHFQQKNWIFFTCGADIIEPRVESISISILQEIATIYLACGIEVTWRRRYPR